MSAVDLCPRPRNSAATRVKILDAATRRFSDASYDQVGIRDIAGDVGVDPALISRYFGSKEELFRVVVQQLGDCSELISGKRSAFGKRAARELLNGENGENKMAWLRVMLLAISSPKAADILQQTSKARFFDPLSAWIGGDDADLKAHLSTALLVGLSVTRETSGGFRLSPAQKEKLHDWLAVLLQGIIDH